MEQGLREAIGADATAFRRRDAPGVRAARRLDVDQRLPAGLRVPAGARARRRARRSTARSSSTAPRSRPTGARSSGDGSPATIPRRVEQLAKPAETDDRRRPCDRAGSRRRDRAARRLPDRLPGRGATQRATARSSTACATRRRARRRRRHAARRGGRAQLLQAARDQGRVRGRAPVHGRRVRAAGRRGVRGRLPQLRYHFAPPLWAKPDPVTGVPAKRTLRPVDAPCAEGCSRASRACAAPGSIPSATPAERRLERALIADYERTVDELLPRTFGRQRRARGGDRGDPGDHPRLRAREAQGDRRGEGARGRAAERLPEPLGPRDAARRVIAVDPIAHVHHRLPVPSRSPSHATARHPRRRPLAHPRRAPSARCSSRTWAPR